MTIDLNAPLDGIRYERDGGIARIQLNRPERGNSLAPSMQRIFRAIWAEVREEDAIRVARLARELGLAPASTITGTGEFAAPATSAALNPSFSSRGGKMPLASARISSIAC